MRSTTTLSAAPKPRKTFSAATAYTGPALPKITRREKVGSMLEVAPHIRIPDTEFEFTFARSSGPGGQNVNKVNSKAILRWNPTTSPSLPEAVRARLLAKFASKLTTGGEFVIASERYRDQPKNIDDCLEKLRTMLLEVARPPKKRRPTKPSRASKERRLDSKRRDSARKSNRRNFGD
jgi:ribosome-associated protein